MGARVRIQVHNIVTIAQLDDVQEQREIYKKKQQGNYNSFYYNCFVIVVSFIYL